MKKFILKAMMMQAEGTAKAAEFKLPEHTSNGGMPTNRLQNRHSPIQV